MSPRKHEDTKTRRRTINSSSWLRVFVASCLPAIVCAQAPTAVTNWPQFRGNARLTGVAAALPDTLKLKWTYEAGESIESSAAIADGAVFVGSSKGELLAIDLA